MSPTIHPLKLIRSDTVHLPGNKVTISSLSNDVLVTEEVWTNVESFSKKSWEIDGVVVAANGYLWKAKYEKGKNYKIGKVLTSENALVGVYCDVTSPIEIIDSVFQCNDWYLDVWQNIKDKKAPILLDAEELELALQSGYMTVEEGKKAQRITIEILNSLEDQNFINF